MMTRMCVPQCSDDDDDSDGGKFKNRKVDNFVYNCSANPSVDMILLVSAELVHLVTREN